MSNTPLVTIFIPVYNREKYIFSAIQSVLNQTFTDFELLIINDGSTDNSENIIFGFQDRRIKYYKNERNLGGSATRNRGLDLANGKYLALLDSDDIALPNRLEVQVAYMESHPDVIVSGTSYKEFGNAPKCKIPLWENNEEIRSYLLWSVPFIQPSVILRLNEIKKKGFRYNEEFTVAEDYDFWTRIAAGTEKEFSNLSDKLVLYRRHNENISSTDTRIVSVRRKVRERLLKPLLGDEYNEKYPDLVELICIGNFSSLAEIAECLDFLFFLKKINLNKKKYSVYYFGKHIENLVIFLTKHFIKLTICGLVQNKLDLDSTKRMARKICQFISEKDSFLKKSKFILDFFVSCLDTLYQKTCFYSMKLIGKYR